LVWLKDLVFQPQLWSQDQTSWNLKIMWF